VDDVPHGDVAREHERSRRWQVVMLREVRVERDDVVARVGGGEVTARAS
jgi:hypothetical protein